MSRNFGDISSKFCMLEGADTISGGDILLPLDFRFFFVDFLLVF